MTMALKVAVSALVALAVMLPNPSTALSPAPVVAVQRAPEPDPEEVYWAEELVTMQAFMAEIDRPEAWAGAIVSAARAEDLSPWLLAAVITVESDWDADLRGDAGEYGLMQVMPGTAEWMAKSLGLVQYNPMDVDTNIRLGAHYLALMVDEYGHGLEPLAAYNGGHGGMTLEVTQVYAMRVMEWKLKLEERWLAQ